MKQALSIVGMTLLTACGGRAHPQSPPPTRLPSVPAIALSLTTPGVPQGAQLMLATVLTNFGIPAEGIALLIAADTIPDLVGTMTNVTSDLVVGTVVAKHGVAETFEVENAVLEPDLVEAET